MKARTKSTMICLALLGLLAAGCTQKGSEPPANQQAQAAEAKKTEPAEPAKAEEDLAPEGWARVQAEDLTEDQKARLEQARAAKKALASTLMGELKAAIGEGNFAKGIEACKEAAPVAREKISEEHDVQLGRTSFKVRNPDNAPDGWRVPFVENRVNEEILLVGPEEALGYMSPIPMGEVCTKCHGASEQIPDEVEKMLAKEYPQDEATGFAPGDLRGWFWVEISKG